MKGAETDARPREIGPAPTFRVEVPGSSRNAASEASETVYVARPRPAPSAAPSPAPAPPLPSWAVALIGGLLLVCISLATALAAVTLDEPAAPAPTADAAPPQREAAPKTFTAAPTPIPVEMLTALEAVGQEPLEAELGRLLEAIGHGFGARSARLEPTLQSYVYRTASGLEWSPDTFHVAVTAPDPTLAQARSDLLRRLFEDAVSAGRLRIGSGAGPHDLRLVTPTNE